MKIVATVMSVLFAMTLLTAGISGTSLAAEKKEVAKDAVKSAAKSTEKSVEKSAAKATKETPKNIDINSADAETLQLIPGIGPKTADAIVKYRKANGKFKSVDDLLSVKGIGEKSLAKMKPFLKLF